MPGHTFSWEQQHLLYAMAIRRRLRNTNARKSASRASAAVPGFSCSSSTTATALRADYDAAPDPGLLAVLLARVDGRHETASWRAWTQNDWSWHSAWPFPPTVAFAQQIGTLCCNVMRTVGQTAAESRLARQQSGSAGPGRGEGPIR